MHDLIGRSESPPTFKHLQRKYFFDVPSWLRPQVRSLDTVVNQVGFVLQWGYFRASGRFFRITTYSPLDVIFVSRQWGADPLTISMNTYRRNTATRHRGQILELLGFKSFTPVGKALIEQEAILLVARQLHPERLFWTLCDYLRSHRIEVPAYFTLSTLIREAIKNVEQQLDKTLGNCLTSAQILLLDELLEKLPDDASGRSMHRLARLKNAQELLRLALIRQNMGILKDLKERYHALLPVIDQLGLSPEMIEYYAEYVLRADIYQVKRRIGKYLILICFVIYQYFHVSDILLQTFLQAAQLTLTKSGEQRDKKVLALQQENKMTLDTILTSYLKGASFAHRLQALAFALDGPQVLSLKTSFRI